MTQDAPRTARPDTATRGLGALLRVPGLPDVGLPALLRYSAADPFAVRLVLLLEGLDEPGAEAGPESVEWVFSRSLLTDGLLAPAGAGDVRVQVQDHEVSVELAGSATVLLPLEGLVEFLAASYDVVPTGAESLALPLDQALAALLG
ncbi:MAG: sporulation and cell division protein SsgA [Frankiales bacterium]|nr:sporulation and cell division protein SsgA [Frankiales bacterium]